ncbi:hypothetical protein L6452_33872 [Arctium lappa]|uniref:Uncharacterized protein n=1 Tax=Arctium lappa TaxID=4217 RepID=A0ACB8YHL1_ARCLA|nr:hypothetical protein L6452_33872 [Arctium lappa]
MAKRPNFLTILVLLLFTTLSFNGVANAARPLRYVTKDIHGASAYELMGSEPRVLQEQHNFGSRLETEINGSEDMRSNPMPRVMGHGQYRIWRSQPSGLGEEQNMEGREIIIPRKPQYHRPEVVSHGLET